VINQVQNHKTIVMLL